LNIDENDSAMKIAETFHRDFKKLKPSSSITREIDTIERTFLKFMPTDDRNWNKIRNYFKQARKEDNPILVVKIFTLDQDLTECLNKHSAANTYHALKLYCTLFNCPILAQTQEYTEAITRIFFHPKLEEFLVRKIEVYRGTILEDKKFVANYKEGATIITTTFLSTTTDRAVAKSYSAVPDGDMNKISVFCTYNINNTHRYTALDVRKMGIFNADGEIIILRYVPFTIRSVEQTDDVRRMTIYFDECKEQCTVEENHC
jgi:hypothetical protein